MGLVVSNVILSMKLNRAKNQPEGEQVYEKHIAMIQGEADDEFWEMIYEGAAEAGGEKGFYVENFGAELSESYSAEELLEMAIAAKVDGIIVEASKSEETERLIDQATAQEIPVVTVISDAKNSQRKSFVSVNDYTVGEMYGQQIIEAAEDTEEAKVTVVTNAGDVNAVPNLIYSGISEKITEQSRQISWQSGQIQLSTISISSTGEFESEEKIRNLVLREEARPDIIVCLNAVDTVSAYQCLIDYNLVGTIQLIGYYTESEVAEGIEKGIIKSAVAVNAKELGRISAEGMYEYITEGSVSEYLPVDVRLVTEDNIQNFKEEGK